MKNNSIKGVVGHSNNESGRFHTNYIFTSLQNILENCVIDTAYAVITFHTGNDSFHEKSGRNHGPILGQSKTRRSKQLGQNILVTNVPVLFDGCLLKNRSLLQFR